MKSRKEVWLGQLSGGEAKGVTRVEDTQGLAASGRKCDFNLRTMESH